MKSKISFFNKTIFLKNVTLYWPIWGVYTLFVLISQPILFWISNSMSPRYDQFTDEQKFQGLINILNFPPYVIFIAFAAIFAGMAIYSYLYNTKSANMIHSLPVDRTQLYGTSLISGWAFLIIPLFVSAVLMTVLCIFSGVSGIEYIWMFFLNAAALALIAFGIVTICAMFTGHIVVLPIYVIIVNYFSWIIYYLIESVITTFGYGVRSLSDTIETIARVLNPFEFFYSNLYFAETYKPDSVNEIMDVSLSGGKYVLIYFIVAIGCYIGAYIVYKTRKIECAGDFLTVKWIKPVFKGVVGVLGGIYVSMLIREVLLETRIGCGVGTFVVFMLLCGVICYFIADMFIKKSFHVFQKKNWLGCGIFSVILLAFFGGMYGLAEKYEKYVPSQSEIKTAYIHMGYEIELEGERASLAVELQKKILENIDVIEAIIESGDRAHDSVRIEYVLESGERVTRRYQLPTKVEALNGVYENILALESDVENYLNNEFGKNYDKVDVFYSGWIEFPVLEGENREQSIQENSFRYENTNLNQEQAKALYYAAVADAKAGTLMKYNIYTSQYWAEEQAEIYTKSTNTYFYVEFKNPNERETLEGNLDYIMNGMDAQDYQVSQGIHLSFGPDCENIVNQLIEMGFIESAKDVWWGEAESLLK